jgi:hypothetical protein
MIILSLASFLAGIVLGQHLKVRVLIPISGILFLLAVGTGVTYGYSAWSIILIALIASTSGQIGYFTGIVIHHVRFAHLSNRPSSLASHAGSARHAVR